MYSCKVVIIPLSLLILLIEWLIPIRPKDLQLQKWHLLQINFYRFIKLNTKHTVKNKRKQSRKEQHTTEQKERSLIVIEEIIGEQ